MMLVLTLAVGLLTATGVYLVLGRRVFPAILGLSMLAHAANLVMLAAGGTSTRAAFAFPGADRSDLADPIPQAFVLTAIVISMALTLYQLAVLVRGGTRLGSTLIEPPHVDDEGRDPEVVRHELVEERGDAE